METNNMPTTELSIPLHFTIITALEQLKDGTLQGKEITVTYRADEPQLMPFLRALAAGAEDQARIEVSMHWLPRRGSSPIHTSMTPWPQYGQVRTFRKRLVKTG
jgi:hypothetical protein